jgi:6,7-dimethyl-8-ribityllumazine synthase
VAQSTSHIFDTEGIHLPTDAFVVIVRTAWNAEIVDKLESGCLQVLDKKNIPYRVITVPGAFAGITD